MSHEYQRHHGRLTIALHAFPGNPNPTEWLVQGLIPSAGLTILASAPKAGKTCLASAIARAIATGTPFLGQEMKKAPVVWCAYEEYPDERVPFHLGLTMEDPLYVAYVDNLPDLDLNLEEGRSDQFGRFAYPKYCHLFQEAKELEAKLIVIDCLHAAVTRGNLADNAFARRVLGRLRHWCASFNIPVLLLHHVTKTATRGYHPERFADSSQILASASTHFYMESRTQPDGSRKITLHGQGRNPIPPRVQELVSHDILDFARVEPGKSETGEPREGSEGNGPTLAESVSSLLDSGGGLSAKEVAEELGANPDTVRVTISRMLERGQIVRRQERSTYLYWLSTDTEASPPANLM